MIDIKEVFHCTKNHNFLCPNALKRWPFQKIALEYDLSWSIRKDSTFFPRKITKDNLSQKNSWKYDIFFKCPEKMFFPKKSRWNMIFHVLSGKMVFFSGKCDIFFSDGKWKMIFLKIYIEIWYFLYMCINVTNMILPFCKNKSEMIFSQKNRLKDDWHSRSRGIKSSSNSLYFYGDLHRCFHILLSSKIKTGNLIYGIEIWLLLQFTWLQIFCNAGVVFKGVLELQLRKLFAH